MIHSWTRCDHFNVIVNVNNYSWNNHGWNKNGGALKGSKGVNIHETHLINMVRHIVW